MIDMGTEFYQVLAFVPLVIMLFGVIVGFIKFTTLGPIQRLVVFLMSLALIADLTSYLLMKAEISTYPVFHFYAPFEYSLLILVFVQFFKRSKIKRLLYLSIPAVWGWALSNMMFWQDITTANTNVTSVLSLTLVLMSVLAFFKILSETIYSRIERSSFFWVITAIIIFFSSSFLLFAYSNWLKPISVENAMNVWLLHVFFNIIHYLCFNIALWMDPE